MFHVGCLVWVDPLLVFGTYFSVLILSKSAPVSVCPESQFCLLIFDLEGNDLMKQRSQSALQHRVHCLSGPTASGSISYVCCVCLVVFRHLQCLFLLVVAAFCPWLGWDEL